MSQSRTEMISALQEIVVPKLRELGFKGRFPHFRRPNNDQIDLLTFQFDLAGGGFVIEISKCPPEGITTYLGDHIPPDKVRAWDMHPNDRFRLQPHQGSSTSDWFRYDVSSRFGFIYEKTAKRVLPFLKIAERWWKENRI